jgi:hypothetical protein
MQLPPQEKGKSHHNFLYIDINQPFKEYKQSINKTSNKY